MLAVRPFPGLVDFALDAAPVAASKLIGGLYNRILKAADENYIGSVIDRADDRVDNFFGETR